MTSDRSHLRMLVLTFTPIAREPRALKQIRHFADVYTVTTAGFGPAPVPGVEHIELDPAPKPTGLLSVRGFYTALLGLRRFKRLYFSTPRVMSAYERLNPQQWDIIIAHDVMTVPLANKLAPRLGVLADLHEYAPRQNEHSFLWRLLIAPYFRWILRKEVTKVAEVTTVSQGIVEEYQRQFGIHSDLVVNATPFHPLTPQPVSKPIRLVHSGIPAPARKLEVMIDAVLATDSDVTLDLFLMPSDEGYLQMLKDRAAKSNRIRFQKPVDYAELIETLHQYDVGLSLIAPTTFNLAWCLPNKFFDFVQARLGVIVGPSPEMVRYVEKHKIGAITDDFSSEALTKVLNALTTEQVSKWKEASHTSAQTVSGENQVLIWDEVAARISSRD